MMKKHRLIKKMAIKCTLCLVLILSCHDANALFIEHNYLNLGPSYSVWQIDYFEPIGQSFFAADDNIGTIGFYVDELNPVDELNVHYSDASLNLSVYEGAGVQGSLLGTMTINTLNEGFSGYADFDVSSLDFISGATYSAVLTAPNPMWGMGGDQGTAEDPVPDYQGGDLILHGQVAWSDAIFHILPKEQPREPRTYSLFIGMDDGIDLMGSSDAYLMYEAFLQNNIIEEQFAYRLANESATKNNISSILDNFDLNENDKFIFYYSGHGDYTSGGFSELFETTLTTGDEVLKIGTTDDDLLSDDHLTGMLDDEKWANVEKWVILDTCFGGGFWGNNNESDYGDLEKLDNIALFAAADEGSLAWFWGGLGVYTGGWLAGLELENGWAKADSNRDGQVIFEEWDTWLKSIKYFNFLYHPYVYEKAIGDIHYVDGPEFFKFFSAKSENFQGTFDMTKSTVPEPGTLMLMGSGLAGFVFFARRKRR